ncbi:hypothetical protein DUNSADRAFT_8825 [Dunaliella salina]|uniref:Protein kinase domain-containing protein n=1 Tax=Dunaliella salina TaxID=3046 RepID=A0ABQ7GIM4_DUNSA|nr:hypothetical protein DUNSADRAFT_8825 [Dunaliella salina]|eukprot:KAF5834469.1 hypothetical protein DUNSADRAFT_8825 [Dunaliella salina]
MQKRGAFSLEDSKFYVAEVVQMLEYLRSKQAFFLPAIGGPGRQSRTTSFVGTAEYVSPELLSGKPPFKAASEYLSFQKVTDVDYTYPEVFPAVAKDLVDKLLVAPSFIPPPAPTVQEEALDWELGSIVRSSTDRPSEASDSAAASELAKGSSLSGTTNQGQQQQRRHQLEQELQGVQGIGANPHHEELTLDTGIVYEKVDRGSSDDDDDDDDDSNGGDKK